MKKTQKRKLAALLLAAATALSVTLTSNASLGSIYYSRSETLRDGLDYSLLLSGIASNDGRSTYSSELRSYVLCYTPGSSAVLPTVSWGEYIYGRETMDELLSGMTGQSSVAAINADFFSLKTGVPMGIVTRGNILYSNNETENALVITQSGAYIAQPSIELTLTNGINSTRLDYYNKYPTEYGAYLLSNDWDVTTHSSAASREIVLSPNVGQLSVNSNVACSVIEIRESVTDSEIPSDCFVITYQLDGYRAEDTLLSSLAVGDELTLSVVSSQDISSPDILLTVGGGDVLLRDGQFDPTIVDEEHERQRNPRTAVGITADGRVIFYACDGRSAQISEGLTLSELATAMAELGCVDALNLDGGGSTTVVIDGETVNKPSDRKQRAISDAVIFLEAPTYAEGLTKSIAVETEYDAVLVGGGSSLLTSRLRLEARELADTLDNSGILYEVEPADMGTIKDGCFIASQKIGMATINAKCDIGEGQISGSTVIAVVPSLTALKLGSDSERLAAFGSITLDISAKYRNLEVGVDLSQLAYEQTLQRELPEGALAVFDFGTLYADGRLVGDGDTSVCDRAVELRASYGGVSAALGLKYGIAETLLDEFEDISGLYGGVSQTTSALNGSKALMTVGKAEYTSPKKLMSGAVSLSIWMPNGSEAYAMIADASGKLFELPWTPELVLAQKGMSRLRAVIPSDALQPITVTAPVICTSGYVISDNLCVDYGARLDRFADVTSEHWASEHISIVESMGIIQGEALDGISYFRPDDALTRAEFAKLLVAYFGLEVDVEPRYSFIDEAFPEWALGYVSSAIAHGLMNGKYISDDGILFDPKAPVTRAEAMQVFGGLLDCEPTDITSFTDIAELPEWAYANSAKVVAAKLITGYPDGTLLPNSCITRGEISVIFVRFDSFLLGLSEA